jgi:hypothetical protein
VFGSRRHVPALSVLCAAVALSVLAATGCPNPPDDDESFEKALTSFAILNPASAGTIDEGAKTVAVTVPSGTDATALVAVFTTTGAIVKVYSTVQASGTTPNDFTDPVPYIVTAADNSTATYMVAVAVALPSPARLVINEIDYDQISTDTEYDRVLPGDGVFDAGAFLLVCPEGMTSPPGVIVIHFTGLTNCIQNRAPDAVLVYDTVTKVVIDALTYEGGGMDAVSLVGETGTFDATEGTGSMLVDSNSTVRSLIRWPDGADTDENQVDFILTTIPTPGQLNFLP